MKLENFHVDVAEWSRESDREALQRIRQQVFVVEQQVSEACERDGLDADCWHVLARDENGRPIGCGRLTLEHKIGRMAVLQEWRGQGVGVALLRELVTRARSLGWPEVSLASLVSALGFYEQAGFLPYGEEFVDAGLQHQSMRLSLTSDNAHQLAHDIRTLPVRSLVDVASARMQVLTEARHQLAILLPVLDRESYSNLEELAEIRRVAISGRSARVRILLHDPEAALRNDHRLIALMQRLTSSMQIRMPLDEVDLAYPSSYLLNDVGGYLFLPEASRAQGRAALDDRAGLAPLRRHFDEVWERSRPATMLQALNI